VIDFWVSFSDVVIIVWRLTACFTVVDLLAGIRHARRSPEHLLG
jgi:hypothetical protein